MEFYCVNRKEEHNILIHVELSWSLIERSYSISCIRRRSEPPNMWDNDSGAKRYLMWVECYVNLDTNLI